MDKKLNIYILNTLSAGIESTSILVKSMNIKGLIGLNNNFEDENIVSGFYPVNEYCIEKGLEFHGLKSYTMKEQLDIDLLLGLDIDILLVLGWQRLIPKWLIDHVHFFCIGAHGSPWGVEKGRGRSPINWALILGKKNFEMSLFIISEGADSGEIIDSYEFTINEYDDINTVYLKSSWVISKLIIKCIEEGSIFKHVFKAQDDQTARYLPKRTPEDGQIDWNRSQLEIFNYIKALTQPYPGAYTILESQKICIWKAVPFDTLLSFESFRPGEIIKYFSTTNNILVKCKHGSILITHWSGNFLFNEDSEGRVFESVVFEEQMNCIIKRHYKKNKEFLCNEEIENHLTNELEGAESKILF